MLTSRFPANEIYGLIHQIRRAVVSIPSNIGEGQGKNSPKGFRSFLGIALVSIGELETQLIASGRTEYLSQNELSPLSTRLDNFRIMLIIQKFGVTSLCTENGKPTPEVSKWP